MRKGKSCIGILLALTFLTGLAAPLPECFVTRLAYPFGQSISCREQSPPVRRHAVAQSPCCAVAGERQDAEPACVPVRLRPWIKPYAPELESAALLVVPASLSPALFHKTFLPGDAATVPGIEQRRTLPEPIPILQRKQSLLI